MNKRLFRQKPASHSETPDYPTLEEHDRPMRAVVRLGAVLLGAATLVGGLSGCGLLGEDLGGVAIQMDARIDLMETMPDGQEAEGGPVPDASPDDAIQPDQGKSSE